MDDEFKSPICVRGDNLYCPLPVAVDSYFNCLVDCHHCYFRRLNRTWGQDLRPSDPENVHRILSNGLKNKNPQTTMAHALKLKKTIRVGNKVDPYQPCEMEHRVTSRILTVLTNLDWTFAIQTRFLSNLQFDEGLLDMAHAKGLLTLIPIISPGAEYDWEILERKRTTPIEDRLKILKKWVARGWNIGVNGEPFIPGLHTPELFRDILKRLKAVGIKSYNTYNFHFNDYVAKRLNEIGIDIMKIWELNQNDKWKPIQRQLCQIADEEGMILGCPDFVNTGPEWVEKANTCCGVNVPNPSRFNTHFFKKYLQKGKDVEIIIDRTWEGIGEKEMGLKILNGTTKDFYTMKDAGMI